MDGRIRLSWLIIFLVIMCSHNSGWVLGTSPENQSGARRKLVSREGFISLDCGIASGSSYTDDETEIPYTSDEEFIETGIIYNVSEQYVDKDTYRYFRSVRSFPDGKRNCYTLRVGERNKYLIRARFYYGNYDGKNHTPIFKLYLGVDEWDTVNISDFSSTFRREIVHRPTTNQINVCLVNTGKGTPFISVLDLRPLNNSIYSPSEAGSLLLYNRYDLGSLMDDIYLIREKDDVYDRLWRPWQYSAWDSINSSLISSSLRISNYKLPEKVMATAATPGNESESFKFRVPIDEDPSQKFYIYMHFAEVMDLQGQIREFTISANKEEAFGGPLSPITGYSETRSNEYSISASTNQELSFSLERTTRSAFPPLMNALEIYTLKDFSLASTRQDDVHAMKMIKSAYAVIRNWQGDPCLPKDYQWQGLTCNRNTPPAIISLNLSSSNLSGIINSSFSSLESLQSLDLSYNNLTGPVPEFFAHLPDLTMLILRGNNLTGSVPKAVMDKFENGMLSFGENPNLCQSDLCQQGTKKKKNFLVPILIPILSVVVITIIIAALAMIFRKFSRRETKAKTMEMATENHKEGQFKFGNCEFSYSEILSITNNFSQIVGRGGFGHVYLGTLADSTLVAVKVPTYDISVQGPKALQTEAKHLTRVRHKNLVGLVGYCDDGTNMALIYEYMCNGNLQKKLFGTDAIVLNWKRRLQIAVDASQGLEYLHNGCKPSIVHRDMKSSNILLNETLQAKISDFGMSRDLATESCALTSTVPAGTPGYLDPQYQSTGILNKSSDVYSFGIVLLELITGQPAIKRPEGIHIVGWVTPKIERADIQSIMDPRLQGDFNTNSAWKALEIGMACVASEGMKRPDMSLVVVDLKECLEIEVASWRIPAVDSHSIGYSGNLMEDSPLVLSTEMAPHAR